MNLDTIRHLMNVEPFEPIELHFASGERHQVYHPDNMAVGRNVIMIAYPDSDRIAHCTPHQIVSIERIIPSKEEGRNGH